MKKFPLRHKLIFWAAVVIGCTLGLFAWLTARHLHREELAELDGDLNAQAKIFFGILQTHPHGELDLTEPHAVEDIFRTAKANFYIEVERGGRLVFRSVNCRDTPLPGSRRGDGISEGHFLDKDLRLGQFRRGDVVLRLGASLEDVEEVTDDLLISFAVTLPLALLALGTGTWLFSRKALGPVTALASSAERITAQNLHERLPVPSANDEIRHLTLVFNSMFDRLEASFRQTVRFTADASHELKTPLTIIRGELEDTLRSGNWRPDQEKLLVGLLDETGRLTTIIDSLLLLSRADAGKLHPRMEPVELAGFVDELREDAETLAAASRIKVECASPPGLLIRADKRLLRHLLLNLLQNAIKYNEPEGDVRLGASLRGATCAISIVNGGPGIAGEHVSRLFERFYRGDTARESDGGHGLGLSIAREVARAHGGDVVFVGSESGRTEFCVLLPLASEQITVLSS